MGKGRYCNMSELNAFKSFAYEMASREILYGNYETALYILEQSKEEDCKDLYKECLRLVNEENERKNKINDKFNSFIEKYRKSSVLYGNSDVYYGELVDGYRQGFGAYIWNNENSENERYIGYWSKGYMSGKGELYLKNGSRYEGFFEKDKFHGFGHLYLKGNEVYIGKFSYGKFDGLGVYYYRDGTCKYGVWKKGKIEVVQDLPLDEIDVKNSFSSYKGQVLKGSFVKQGYGVIKYYNGDVYEGNWSNDRKNGNGILISNGEKINGVWLYDRLVKVYSRVPIIKNK